MISFQEKYEAIVRKDASFEGIFVTAVKTTGIFCRPVCPARKPKPENVIFYDSAHEAILNGYRPCQVCKPMEQADKTPPFIQALIDEISNNPEIRLKDNDLRKRGLEPSQLRRWFKRNHNMSFQSFQRMLRINKAFDKINDGQSITSTAFDVGYNSLSGFNETFRGIMGDAPTSSKDRTVINIVRFTTPLGPMFACATARGVCMLEFTDRRMVETEFKDLQKRLKAVILPGENQHLKLVTKQVEEYFEGKRKQFTVPLDTPGTDFQQSVWKELMNVSYGETCSYKQLAITMGKPNATRAIGNANGHNRVAVIIPCHRVIGENGNLVGYGGGTHRKKWLIDFEKSNG